MNNFEVREFSSFTAYESKEETGKHRFAGSRTECQKWVSAHWSEKPRDVFWAVQSRSDS